MKWGETRKQNISSGVNFLERQEESKLKLKPLTKFFSIVWAFHFPSCYSDRAPFNTLDAESLQSKKKKKIL